MKRLLNSIHAFAAITVVALAGCATQPTSPRTVLAPMPEAVTSFGAVSHDGWLYICGGHKGERHDYSTDEVSGSFHRLNLADGRAWEKLPAAEPAQGAPLVASGGYVYRIGGMAAQNRKGEKQNLLSKSLVTRFDPQHGRWEELTPLPAARSSHDAAIVGNKLYVGGGWQLNGGTNKSTWHESLLVLDLTNAGAQWQSVPQPFKRRALAVAALGDHIYFLGGMDSSNKTSQAVDIFDTKSGAWSKGPELPSGPMKGFGSSAIAQAGRLYWSGMKGDLYQLSASGATWELVGKLSHARFFHRLVPAGSAQLIAAGGEDSEGKRNDLELLTPSPKPIVAGQSANPSNQHVTAQ
jgi:N-acetylneuraminic acid mutarotase